MSAFICSGEHIAVLLQSALACDEAETVETLMTILGLTDDELIDLHTAGPAGLLCKAWVVLMNQNIRSVNFRYRENTALVDSSAYRPAYPTVGRIAVAKLIRCLMYQSCETPDWYSTPAFRICDRLNQTVAPTPTRGVALVEYEEAPWAI